jgi:hypothetical protein
VLQGEREVKVRRQAPVETPKHKTSVDAGADDANLFDILRNLRRTIAASRGVPPYVVFSDRTLNEMVQRMPRTEEEMLQVSGIAEVKLAQFGQAFLTAIRDYARDRGAPGSMPSPTPAPAPARVEVPKRECPSETEASWRLLQQGVGMRGRCEGVPGGGRERQKAPGPQAGVMPPAPPPEAPGVRSRVKYTANGKPQTGEVLAEVPGGLRIKSDSGAIHLVPPDAVLDWARQ